MNYGYLSIDTGMLDSARIVLEAAYNLAPGHMPVMEGMAAYWLAKGGSAKAKEHAVTGITFEAVPGADILTAGLGECF